MLNWSGMRTLVVALVCFLAWAPGGVRPVGAQHRLAPIIPRVVDENAWFAIADVLELSDDQVEIFWQAVSVFEDDFEAEVASMGRGFALPSPPAGGAIYDAVDATVAAEITEFYEECERTRRRMAASAEAVAVEMTDVLSEGQLARLPAARRLARRAVWLGSLSTLARPPGVGRDLEAWIRLEYADLLQESGTVQQREMVNEMLDQYSVRADVLARELADISGETAAAFILLEAGQDARIEGKVWRAAEGRVAVCDQLIEKGKELFQSNDRLVRDILSVAVAGFSDKLFRDWIDATTPEGIARFIVQPEIAANLADALPPAAVDGGRLLVERLRSQDLIAVLAMRDAYLKCHFEAWRQCAKPFGVCGDTCEQIAKMQRARLRSAGDLLEQLIDLAEAQPAGLGDSSPRLGAVRRHRVGLLELAEVFAEGDGALCDSIGRLGL